MDVAKKLNLRQATISDIENGKGTLNSFFCLIQAMKLNVILSTGELIIDNNKKSKTRSMLDLIESGSDTDL